MCHCLLCMYISSKIANIPTQFLNYTRNEIISLNWENNCTIFQFHFNLFHFGPVLGLLLQLLNPFFRNCDLVALRLNLKHINRKIGISHGRELRMPPNLWQALHANVPVPPSSWHAFSTQIVFPFLEPRHN